MELEEEETIYNLGRLEAPNGHRLKHHEYYMLCPFDMTHVIINTTMQSHLFKCRRAHLKNIEKSGKIPHFRICKYNPDHLILEAELEYHEELCPYRRIQGLGPDAYRTSPLPPKPRMISPASLSASASSSSPSPQNWQIQASTTWNNYCIPNLPVYQRTGAIYSFEGSDKYSDLVPEPDDLLRDVHKHILGKSKMLDKRKLETLDSSEKGALEDWDLQAKLFPPKVFNAMYYSQYQMKKYISPPPGLTKSERKAWRQDWLNKMPRPFDPTDPDFVKKH